MTTFALQLREFARKAGRNADLVVAKVVLDVGTSLVMKSPVGDADYWLSPAPPGYVGGRFRANWQHGEERINTTTTEETDQSGADTVGKLAASIPNDASGKVHYLTNALAYGPRLEEGWSRQAPNGMVGLTVIEFQSYVAKAVRDLPG